MEASDGGRSVEVPEVLRALDPSPEPLLKLLSAAVDDSMLEEIAAADYGDRRDEHLAALREIRDRGRVFAPMEWCPREVLELIRWSHPENPEWGPGSTGTRGHRMRAFSCAALLRAAAEPENAGYFDGENQTAAHLVQSAVVLGRETTEAALRFIAWRLGTLPRDAPLDEEDRPFFALGLLLLAAHLSAPSDDPRRLFELADLVVAEEASMRTRKEAEGDPAGPRWLLDLTIFGLCHDAWRGLARKVLVAPSRPLPAGAAGRLAAIGRRLLGGA